MKLKIKKHIDKNISNDEIVELLLKNRGIKDKKDFLNPPHPKDIPFEQLFSKREFEKLAKKLKEIREKKEMVVVYTDYDADGICGGAILWETLHLLGFKVMPYVPHRKHEGYGFSQKGIDAVKKLYQPSLVISVDHGITAAERITYAKKLGIPIVITDHHLEPTKIPQDALAIFHNEKLSGSGVAYFLAKQIFMSLRGVKAIPHCRHCERSEAISKMTVRDRLRNPVNEIATSRPPSGLAMTTLKQNFSIDYLSLASIGTIADLVPLIGPSRSIVKHGLQAFAKVKRYGIKHILKEAGIEERTITPYEVGFIIAPRINAIGRLEHAIDALRLLCTVKEERAVDLAKKIGEKNRERQSMVEEAVEKAKEKVQTLRFGGQRLKDAKMQSLPKIIILYSEKWNEGIIGLIAAKIAEEFYRPTIVMTMADGFAKGSARSIPSFDITSFLRSQKKYLIDVGGHKGASGFTIEKEKVEQFIKKAAKEADKLLSKKDLEKTLTVDFSFPLSLATVSLVKKLENLSPFGVGNPSPIFYSEGDLIEAKLFGKNNHHLKLYLKDQSSQFPKEFVFFGEGQKFFKLSRGQKIGLVYTLEIDRWGGEEKVRGKGKEIIFH